MRSYSCNNLSINAEPCLVNGEVLTGTLPMSRLNTEGNLHVFFRTFDFTADFPLSEFHPEIERGRVTVSAMLDGDVVRTFELTGAFTEEETLFKAERVSFQIAYDEKRATSLFAASTIDALFALSEEVDIIVPGVDSPLRLRFAQYLRSASIALQRRQLAYRLMMIELATGEEFILPYIFRPSEIESVVFTYYALVEQSFLWRQKIQTITIPATHQGMSKLASLETMADKTIAQLNINKALFGKSISLGPAMITLTGGRIENLEDARNKLAHGDGRLVDIVIRSDRQQARYEFLNASRFPEPAWDLKTQALMDLESKLDKQLVEGYNALAAASLAGLTEREKAEITAGLNFSRFGWWRSQFIDGIRRRLRRIRMKAS